MKNGNTLKKDSVDLEKIAQTGQQLLALAEQVKRIFPGREGLIDQIVYALLTRQHILMFGIFGTGKSDLINTIAKQIVGAQKMFFSLNKFSTDSAVFGAPSTLTVDGKTTLEFDVDGPGTIFKSHIVEFDEMFDASQALLRTLLGILNERIWKRGRYFVPCELHTAFASTNKDPAQAAAEDSQLDAVLDRILFHCQVDWLTTTEQRLQMYSKFLNGSVPTIEIKYDDLAEFSRVVLDANQIEDPIIIETYEKIIEAFCAKYPLKKVSDRRKCMLFQLIEAQALLNGRFEAHPEDILAVKFGLCYGNDTEALEAFDEIAAPHIAAAKEAMAQNVDQLQVQFITELDAKVALLNQETLDQTVFFTQAATLASIRKDADTIKPELTSTKERLKQLLAAVEKRQAELDKFSRGG